MTDIIRLDSVRRDGGCCQNTAISSLTEPGGVSSDAPSGASLVARTGEGPYRLQNVDWVAVADGVIG